MKIQFASMDSIKAASSWMLSKYAHVFKRLADDDDSDEDEDDIQPNLPHPTAKT